ncbi:serpentine type 7TM GPCR chemoreceptor srsx domain-containing protein [Ditylenchus destructor]|nr:serpentine type 7TM GPCR chemoreceptor srsx domain-containing protein [Ditylenchus destructor]
MNGSEVQSQLYYKYKDYGIIPLAAPASFMMLVIGLFGHFGNISIIYGTVKNNQVICVVVEGMTKESLASMFNYQIAHNIITVLCYVGVWLCIRFKTKGPQTSQRILKSLVIITTVLILGWTINAFVQTMIISTLKLSDDVAFFIEDYCGLGGDSYQVPSLPSWHVYLAYILWYLSLLSLSLTSRRPAG